MSRMPWRTRTVDQREAGHHSDAAAAGTGTQGAVVVAGAVGGAGAGVGVVECGDGGVSAESKLPCLLT